MTFEERVQALEPLMLTARQTRFLVTVALHGGYCLRRQYQVFARVRTGNAVKNFLEGLVARQLAERFNYRRDRGYLYHVSASSIYRALGESENGNRRASPALIARRLMLLDYVLSTPDVEWFASEADKMALFRDRLGIPVYEFPQRTYGRARSRDRKTVRYFPHKQPIGLADNGGTVVFAHVVTDTSGRGFEQFLKDHRRLFGRVQAWRIVAVCARHIGGLPACKATFDRFVRARASASLRDAQELPWFFATRRHVEHNEFANLSIEDISRFREVHPRFDNAEVDALYASWLDRGEAVLASVGQASAPRDVAPPELVLASLPGRYEQFGSLAGIC